MFTGIQLLTVRGFKKGQTILARDLEAIRRAARVATGVGPSSKSRGFIDKDGALVHGGGGTPAVSTSILVKITDRSGTAPPYHYSGVEVELDSDGDYIEVDGGIALAFKMQNLNESGTPGTFITPIQDDFIVRATKATNDWWTFEAINDMGTYLP